MNTHSKSGSHRSVRAKTRAANAWSVAPSKVIVCDRGNEPSTAAVSLDAPAAEPANDRARARALATAIVTLAAEEGLDAAFEAIERGLMGMSVLPDDARARADLRGLSELMDIAAVRLGLRGDDERG